MILLDGLISAYPFDGDCKDAHASNDGMPTDISFVGGKLGQSGTFNGSSSKVAVPQLFSSVPFSVAIWINPNLMIDSGLANDIGLLNQDDGSNGFAVVFLAMDDGRLRFLTNNGNIQSTRSQWNAGTWYHIVVVQESASSAKIYIDGQLDFSGDNGFVAHVSRGFYIGARITGGISTFWPGSVDQVLCYDRALAADEILNLYNSGVGFAYPFTAPSSPTDPYAGQSGVFSDVAENAGLDHIHGTPFSPPASVYLALSLAWSVVDAAYQWTASGSGTAEYYLELSGGGDPGFFDPGIMIENGQEMTRGTAGSLAAGEWDFADNDSIGGNRIYVRLADDSDPDTKASGYVMAGGNPGNDGSMINEPTDTYARQPIAFSAAASRKVVQSGDIAYAKTTAAWGAVTHWAVFAAASGGNMLAYGLFSSVYDIGESITPTIYSAQLWIGFPSTSNNAGYTDYCVHGLLDLIFRNQAFSVSGLQMALISDVCTDTDADLATDVTEMSGTGYAPIPINPAGGASPAFTAASAGLVNTADAVSWGQPGADDWTQLSGLVLADTNGKILLYDNTLADFPPTTADTIEIDAGGYQAALH